ncbi:hypothetical protein JCM17960_17250 [Magnetospira thiophila]
MRYAMLPILAGVACATGLGTPTWAEEDTRTLLTLQPEIQAQFLQEMRGHMETLDDLITAIGAGDFKQAATIADTKLDFGHHIWDAMAAQGAGPEQIAEMKQRMQAMGAGGGQGADMTDEEHLKMEQRMAEHMGGMGMGRGMGMGMGRYMTPEFRQMGQSMHAAGGELAKVLQASATPPSAEDYRHVMESLSDVTAVCRACHATFRIR